MEKILTISIAAYNIQDYLRDALESLVVPEVMDSIEVLIVNDGSTDDTPSIAEEYQKNYPNTFRLINKKNGGWGSTVNTGLINATGKYFKLLDGDDRYTNLSRFVSKLAEIDTDMVYTPYLCFYDDSDDIVHKELRRDLPLDESVELTSYMFDETYIMHACTFKTSTIQGKYKISEKCFYTDEEYIMQSIENVRTVYFWPTEVYCYRLGRYGQSVSIEGYKKHYKEVIHVLFKLLKRYRIIENACIKALYEKKLRIIVDQVYDIYLHMEPTKKLSYEFWSYDKRIKRDYPEFYATTRNRVKIFRMLGAFSYKYLVYK